MMRLQIKIKDFISSLISLIIDDPASYDINVIESNVFIIIEIHTSSENLGRIVGKKGIYAEAIRTLVRAIGGKHNKKINFFVRGDK